MSNENTYIQIHRFLKGEMDKDEQLAFEKEMGENEILKNDTLMENRLLNGLNLAADKELKNDIGEVHQNLKTQGFFKDGTSDAKIININRRNNFKRIIAIAASIIIIAAAWWAINQQDGQHAAIDSEELFANNYKPENQELKNIIGNVGFIDEDDSKEYKLKEALQQYENGEFTSSLKSLTALNEEFPNDSEIELYLALSHIETNNHQAAIDLFRPLSIADFDLQEDAKWYLGLLLIKEMEDMEETKDLFFSLSQDNSSKYNERASNILQELQVKK